MEDLNLYFKDVKERIISLEEAQERCSLPMIDKKYNIEKAKLELIKSTIVFCNYLEESKIKF
jgi:hypothetical protein